MKKDSIQTRKRKPKGQGKGKAAKNQKVKITNEKELSKTKVSDSSYSVTNFSSYLGSSISTDPPLSGLAGVTSLSNSFNKQSEINTAQKTSTDQLKSSSSIAAGLAPATIYAASPSASSSIADHIVSTNDPKNQVRSPGELEHYSPLSQCVPDTHDPDLITGKSELLRDEGLHQVTSSYLNYTDQSDQKHLTLINASDKANFSAIGQPVYSTRSTGEVIDTTETSSAGLATMYAGGSATTSSIRDSQYRRHFLHFHPNSHYADYRPSYIKSEPTVK